MEIIAVILGLGLLAALIGSGDEDGDSSPDTGSETPEPGPAEEGTTGPDVLSGTSGNDVLSGLAGFDDLDGGAGDDRLFGGDGKDLLIGGAGDDIAYGGAWHDGLFGGAGDDFMRGDLGDDVVVGGEGDDTLLGNAGDDFVIGGAGADSVSGGDGDDVLVGADIFLRDLDENDFRAYRDDILPTDEDGTPTFVNFVLTGTSDGAADSISGGEGSDLIFVGSGDVVASDGGFDDIVIGDWIDPANQAQIADFDGTADLLLVAIQEDSTAEITVDEFEPGSSANILIDGQVVAVVEGTWDTVDGISGNIIQVGYVGT